MKKIVILCFLYVLFMIVAGELRSEQFGSATTYSLPSYIEQHLDSPGSQGGQILANSCNEYYEPNQPVSCTGTSSFWQRLQLYGW
ncbi:MAG: hypothetical protein LBK82_10570, partial [Planctomycetaceae bacterium]|nr:hypothetical protein [Planctomycetaceae bacterium]